MIKNTLGDLNGYLFETIERLNNSETKGYELKEEIERANAMGNIAKTIVSNANLVLQARKFDDDKMDAESKTPKMLEG